MRCWVLPGSVQLQDYYIRPEKMGAPRKDLADAILSYNGNDSQKNGEPFYRPLLQGCPDVPKYPELPFPRSPIGREALLHGHSSREYPPDGNPRSTAVRFRRGVHGVSKNAAVLSHHSAPIAGTSATAAAQKQSPESMFGNSDGRYAPMGNTSSVIDGDAVSRAQSVAS